MKSVAWDSRYRDGVLKLLTDVPFKSSIWSWQFQRNPFGKPFQPVLVVNDDDQVIGFNGVMPVVIMNRGRHTDAIWSCDFYVSPEWRGKKLGSRIKAVLHERYNIIMAFGVSDKASLVLNHLGWQQQDYVYNYRYLRRPETFRQWVFKFLQLTNRIRGGIFSKYENYSIKVQSRLPPEKDINDLWEKSESGYASVVIRNYAYLDWKYQNHPLTRYAYVSAWEGSSLKGLMIVRYHKGLLRLVDYCGPARNKKLKTSLIRACLENWQQALYFTIITTDREMAKCLIHQGFYRSRSKPKFFVYSPAATHISQDKNWFIMSGDSDGELLSAAADMNAGDMLPAWIKSERYNR